MKYPLSTKISEKIILDNDFSLALSMHLKKRQDTVIRLVKRKSDILRLPEQINFYKSRGYTDEEIFESSEEKPVD